MIYDPDNLDFVTQHLYEDVTREEFLFRLRHHSAQQLDALNRMLQFSSGEAGDYLLGQRIKARTAPDGKLYIEESGRDCDGVRYWGQIRELENPSVEAYYQLLYDIGEWADGPFWLRILKPEEVEEVRREAGSRDLGMEAFEDGHNHVIYD